MAVGQESVVGLELERVLPNVQTVFESDDKFYSRIKNKSVKKVSQREMRVPLKLRPGGKFRYFTPNGGDLGRGGGPTWDKAVLQPVFISEATEYTKLAEWATDSNRKSVQNAVREMVATQLDELTRQLDGQLMQDGTGVVAVSLTVDTAPTTYDTFNCTSEFGARLVRYQQEVQVYDTNLTTLRGTSEIVFWDEANSVLRLSPKISGLTNGDKLVAQGLSSPTTLPALYGVPYHHSNASTGTWLGFDRASTPEIRSNGINASSAALSLPLPRQAINAIGNRVGIDNKFSPDAWMHPAQKQAYEEIGQLVSQIYKEPTDQKLNMYFDQMQMAGAPVVISFNWSKKRIDFVTEGVWGRGEILPIGFYKTDGRNIFEIRGSSGGVATADIFYMVIGTQTFVNNPAATAYIYDLAIPSGY